jgi:putative SOS response-associated peptidase YedK
MCGRYYRTADKSALQDVFTAVATGAAATYAPAYNIPPHSIQLIVRQARDRAAREIVPMRWVPLRSLQPTPIHSCHFGFNVAAANGINWPEQRDVPLFSAKAFPQASWS